MFITLSSPALIALSLTIENLLFFKFNSPPEISTASFPQLIKEQLSIVPKQKSASKASEKVFSIVELVKVNLHLKVFIASSLNKFLYSRKLRSFYH